VPITFNAAEPVEEWRIRVRNSGGAVVDNSQYQPYQSAMNKVLSYNPELTGNGNGLYDILVNLRWANGTGSTSKTFLDKIRIDKIDPSLSLDPLPTVTTNPEVTITGTASDNHSVKEVRINGLAVALSGNSFSEVLNLSEGVHQIEVVVEDQACNTATVSQTITLDTIAPELTLTVTESSDYAHVVTNTTYYGQGSGSFTATAVATDATLSTLTFPDTTSAGAVVNASGAVLSYKGPIVNQAEAAQTAGNRSSASRASGPLLAAWRAASNWARLERPTKAVETSALLKAKRMAASTRVVA
jgi:hypothetical protein